MHDFGNSGDCDDSGDRDDPGDPGDSTDRDDSHDSGDSTDRDDSDDSGDSSDRDDSGDSGDSDDSSVDPGDSDDSGDSGDSGDSKDRDDSGDSKDRDDPGVPPPSPINKIVDDVRLASALRGAGSANDSVTGVPAEAVMEQVGLLQSARAVADPIEVSDPSSDYSTDTGESSSGTDSDSDDGEAPATVLDPADDGEAPATAPPKAEPLDNKGGDAAPQVPLVAAASYEADALRLAMAATPIDVAGQLGLGGEDEDSDEEKEEGKEKAKKKRTAGASKKEKKKRAPKRKSSAAAEKRAPAPKKKTKERKREPTAWNLYAAEKLKDKDFGGKGATHGMKMRKVAEMYKAEGGRASAFAAQRSLAAELYKAAETPPKRSRGAAPESGVADIGTPATPRCGLHVAPRHRKPNVMGTHGCSKCRFMPNGCKACNPSWVKKPLKKDMVATTIDQS